MNQYNESKSRFLVDFGSVLKFSRWRKMGVQAIPSFFNYLMVYITILNCRIFKRAYISNKFSWANLKSYTQKWFVFIYPKRIFSVTNMVETSVPGYLRMRKQNTKTTVPLDAVPESRTERCSPKFRPCGRFLGEPRVRYLSARSEGEKTRPLVHFRQIPLICSGRS